MDQLYTEEIDGGVVNAILHLRDVVSMLYCMEVVMVKRDKNMQER